MNAAPLWHLLSEIATDRSRFGNKAVRLAQALRQGARVVPGWVLDVPRGEEILGDPVPRARAAKELLSIDPAVKKWLLRSSSPAEDQAGSSAAGLFASEIASPTPADLERGLRTVIESVLDPALPRLLGSSRPTVAVLAQPLLHFDRWCTVEVDSDSDQVWLEGWITEGDGTEPWQMIGTLRELDLGPAREALLRGIALATSIVGGACLMECGTRQNEAWLLQLRPAPSRRPSPPPRVESEEGEAPVLGRGWGLRVHPQDSRCQWRWDSEHSPTPVAPLLAGLFGEWIASSPEASASRLHHGYWFDPVQPPSPTEDFDLEAALAQVDREQEELRAGLRRLESLLPSSPEDSAPARRFCRAWIQWQAAYFARSTRGVRAWIRRERRIQARLTTTAAAQRERRWHSLAARLQTELPELPPQAQALAAWIEANPGHPLGRALLDEARRCAHLSAHPYDGRGRFWGEDPWPLWREISRRRGRTPPPPKPTETTPAEGLITAAENDNEALFQSYWLFRRALQGLAPSLHLRRGEELVDLLPEELWEALDHSDPLRWKRARQRGRALSLQWHLHHPGKAVSGTSILRGEAAAPGRCRAPLWVGSTLADLDRSPPPIAVVPTVTPADAIYFDRIEGLVCEGGDALGHASILAREHGLPCLVRVGAVEGQLSAYSHGLLDADAGELHLLPGPEVGSEVANS